MTMPGPEMRLSEVVGMETETTHAYILKKVVEHVKQFKSKGGERGRGRITRVAP